MAAPRSPHCGPASRRRRGTPLAFPNEALSRHRFPSLEYCSVVGLIAAPIAMQRAFPVGLGIMVVIAGLVAVFAVGFLVGREYVSRRPNRRYW